MNFREYDISGRLGSRVVEYPGCIKGTVLYIYCTDGEAHPKISEKVHKMLPEIQTQRLPGAFP